MFVSQLLSCSYKLVSMVTIAESLRCSDFAAYDNNNYN